MNSFLKILCALNVILIFFGCSHVDPRDELFSTAIRQSRSSCRDKSQNGGRILEWLPLTEEEYIEKVKNNESAPPYSKCNIWRACGFTPGERYTFYSVNMLNQTLHLDDLEANEEGLLVSTVSGMELSLKVFFPGVFMKGEKYHFVLISEDIQTSLAVTIIPKPMHHEWEDGASVKVEIESLEGWIFSLQGDGFNPGESFVVTSKSCDEILSGGHIADCNGKWIQLLLPAVVKKTGGPVNLRVKRADNIEVAKFDFSWGRCR